MKAIETSLPGVFKIETQPFADARGSFVKPLNRPFFEERGWQTDYEESFYSTSAPNVLRGIHFQVPPKHGAKLVCCMAGHVLDALVDLRRGSPCYGKHVLIDLSGDKAEAVYMPAGIAHGFWVKDGPATMLYYQNAYDKACDSGLSWKQVGIEWPFSGKPILSERDEGFPGLREFGSPFTFIP